MIETMTNHELEEKLKEDSEGENINVVQVPIFFKRSSLDKLVIAMPKVE